MVCLLKFYSDVYPNSFADLLNPGIYKQSFSSLGCFIPLHVFSVYSFIYILLPNYLQRKRYEAFIIASSIVALCIFAMGIFLSMLHFKILGWQFTGADKLLATFRTSIYQGILLAFFSTGTTALAIKLVKNWYLQLLENTKLVKLKIEKEIQMLKAHIRPAFLFRSLNILHKKIMSGENDAPRMVLQLSELLSHLLYDENNELISIEKELENLYLLIDVEKMNRQSSLVIKISMEGNCTGKYIYPLVMFSYLHGVLAGAEMNKDQCDVLNIVITIEDQTLFFKTYGYLELATEFALYDNPSVAGIFENATTGINVSKTQSAFF